MAGKAKLVTLADITVAAAGTRVQVSANAVPVYKLYVSAKSANTGNMFIGDSNVSATQGIEVVKGTTQEIRADGGIDGTAEMMLLSDFYVDAATSGDKVKISYVTR